MWNVIGNIASICSIIALPIALWQIYGLKKRVNDVEAGIRSVLELKEHEKLEYILKDVANQYQKSFELISLLDKKGKSTNAIGKRCRDINEKITSCIIDLPPQFIESSKGLKEAAEHIELFIESDMQATDELKDARDYLYNVIQRMKEEIKDYENEKVKLISYNS